MTILLQGAGLQATTVAPSGPLFSSAEIGAVNASTVVVTFDQSVSANENDFALGVTIKVNGVATSISGGIRQSNHAVVWYGIPVLWHGSGDSITWEYDSGTGIIVAESDSTPLGNVSTQAVTNNCEYTALLDLQADMLALNDGDPVSTWADQSGNGHDFTSSGIARPTFDVSNPDTSTPAVAFDQSVSYMLGDNWSDMDNRDSFSVFMVSDISSKDMITKMNNTSNGAGWALFNSAQNAIIQEAGGNNWIEKDYTPFSEAFYGVSVMEVISKSVVHIYVNGNNTNETDVSSPPVSNYSTSEKVILGMFGNLIGAPDSELDYTSAVLFCVPSPNATNRAALEARLAARYGITLP